MHVGWLLVGGGRTSGLAPTRLLIPMGKRKEGRKGPSNQGHFEVLNIGFGNRWMHPDAPCVESSLLRTSWGAAAPRPPPKKNLPRWLVECLQRLTHPLLNQHFFEQVLRLPRNLHSPCDAAPATKSVPDLAKVLRLPRNDEVLFDSKYCRLFDPLMFRFLILIPNKFLFDLQVFLIKQFCV